MGCATSSASDLIRPTKLKTLQRVVAFRVTLSHIASITLHKGFWLDMVDMLARLEYTDRVTKQVFVTDPSQRASPATPARDRAWERWKIKVKRYQIGQVVESLKGPMCQDRDVVLDMPIIRAIINEILVR